MVIWLAYHLTQGALAVPTVLDGMLISKGFPVKCITLFMLDTLPCSRAENTVDTSPDQAAIYFQSG
jgi:hypothetical protein